jgi:hypothetical protein
MSQEDDFSISNISPEFKKLADRLVASGWLENVTDNPKTPDKKLHWYTDPQDPVKDGYARFLTFNLLLQELTKEEPMTEDDLIAIPCLLKALRASGK